MGKPTHSPQEVLVNKIDCFKMGSIVVSLDTFLIQQPLCYEDIFCILIGILATQIRIEKQNFSCSNTLKCRMFNTADQNFLDTISIRSITLILYLMILFTFDQSCLVIIENESPTPQFNGPYTYIIFTHTFLITIQILIIT